MDGNGAIRPATADDGEAIAAIYRPIVTRTAISFELEPPTGDEMAERIGAGQATDPWLVLEIDGRIAGYAYASAFRARPAYAHSRETTVYVDPAHRGLRVGHRLMSALLGQLDDAGIELAVAGIVVPNEASIALHERLGFAHVGTFRRAGRKFDRWHDLGFWQRLRPSG